jgi:hypothetical protein
MRRSSGAAKSARSGLGNGRGPSVQHDPTRPGGVGDRILPAL